MFVRKRVIPTKRRRHRSRRFYGLTVKDGLKFLSSLILPLMLGIFTVVVTFEQQKVARQQRLEDKEDSRRQREQDWNISQNALIAQSKVASERYQDEVLVDYTKEIGGLLEKKNGSLTSDPLTAVLARVKTLNAIEQLDGSRQIHIIRFLYEARQLTNTDDFVALDISTATLTGIDFRTFTLVQLIQKISLAGIYLLNSTFETKILKNVNFSSAGLLNVSFSSAMLDNVNFSSAQLHNVNFSSALLENVNFSSAGLDNVNFSSAWLDNVNFSSAGVYNVNFSSARLDSVNFSSARLVTSPQLNVITNFRYTYAVGAMFVKCDCYVTDFTGANLMNSSFHSAVLNEANFSFANLQNADFTNTTITDNQLQSALSIRNAKLPNGTLGQGRNLVRNGDPNCNISLVHHWQIQSGNIFVVTSKNNRSKCQFTLQSLATGAIMSQRITLVGIWDPSIWSSSNVELKAYMSSEVSIELSGKAINGTVLDKRIANSTNNKIIMELKEDMQELEVVVKFNGHNNKNNYDDIWCDNIKLFVDYDMWPFRIMF